VIHNGLDLSLYRKPADGALRESLEVGPGPVALAIANLIPYKGHTFLLKAWKSVLSASPMATLLLAGEGPARSALEAEARDLGVADRVRFLGVRRDIPALLAVSDVLVHPSLEEGFCNALLEAMAAGKPVVATDVGGNAEAVTNGTTGWLVPARDANALAGAIRRIFEDPGLGVALGAAGRRVAETRFTRDAMVRQYESLYMDLLKRKRGEQEDVRHRRAV